MALFITQLIYGANYSFTKVVMPEYIQPFGFILVRVIGGLVLFFIASLFVKEKVQTKDIGRLGLLALFGVAINQLLFYKGLNLSTPINASIMMISNPIIVMIIMAFILRERISSTRILGILIGISGALTLLLFNNNFTFGSTTITGDVLVLINSASWAVYTILVKPLMRKYATITILKWCFAFGLIFILPFSYEEFQEVEWENIPRNVYWCIGFVVVCTTFIAYLLNTYALKELSPSVVSIYIYLQPFLASLIAIGLGQDRLDPIKVTAGLLIIAGVVLASKPSRYDKKKVEIIDDYSEIH